LASFVTCSGFTSKTSSLLSPAPHALLYVAAIIAASFFVFSGIVLFSGFFITMNGLPGDSV
jgi:hypothetical protein